MRRISQLCVEFPSFGDFLDGLDGVFLAWPAFRERVHARFLALEPGVLRKALADLEASGTPTPIDPRRADHIVQLWQSDFFRLFLDSVGFYPPAEANPATVLQPPVRGIEEAVERDRRLLSLYGVTDYWKINLQRTYPEIFLGLDHDGSGAALHGCDLACGWGRAALALRNPGKWRLHCCDYSLDNLQTTLRFLHRSGASNNAIAHRCDVTHLPFADHSLDFTIALDLFELLTDESLDRVLLELLRCHKLGATLYCKVTLHARAPVLGQVQYFTRDLVISVFTRHSCQGKRLRLKLSDPLLPEHFTFEVVQD